MPQDRIVLGCLGRLHEQKNLTFALDVLAELPEAVLFLAGEGPEEPSLRARAESLGISARVSFLGSLVGEDVTRFYQAIDLLLFPSLYEGFGRVLVEAMSQGVPIVANDLQIVREVGGQCVDRRPLDVREWVRAVRTANCDTPLGISGEYGRAKALEYSVPKMVDGYLAAAGLASTRGVDPVLP